MQVNMKIAPFKETTHEGAHAVRINAEQQLRRSVMACMLWEGTFYESGEDIATRIKNLIPNVKPEVVAQIAIDARTKQHLRHVPLLIVRTMAALDSHKHLVGKTLAEVIQRPDEISEYLAIYWKDGKCPLSKQSKLGIAAAFNKFNEYNLAKYNNQDKVVKLRDAVFLCHVDPYLDKEFDGLSPAKVKLRKYKNGSTKLLKRHDDSLIGKLINGTLKTPDTWEVNLSAGKDKKETFNRLMGEMKLGGLAFLRNLRNMQQAGIAKDAVAIYADAISLHRILPFRFIAAARAVPQWEPIIEKMMLRALTSQTKLPGKTVIVCDNSGSMDARVSAKSDISRRDAACALAILVREISQDAVVISFSDRSVTVPPRHGFALRDAISQATNHGGTDTGSAINTANKEGYDRIIVITDEQSQTQIGNPLTKKAYFLNVATDKNGIGYGPWVHIDGWSESVIDYIRASEGISQEKCDEVSDSSYSDDFCDS